jgi:hypothetical protein
MILVAAQDLFERWQKMDASVLTEEEVAQGAITKARWMALRDSRSSTQTQAAAPPLPPATPPPLSVASGHRLWHRRRRLRLVGHTRTAPRLRRQGFRIDAVATPHGHKTAFNSELFRVREDAEVRRQPRHHHHHHPAHAPHPWRRALVPASISPPSPLHLPISRCSRPSASGCRAPPSASAAATRARSPPRSSASFARSTARCARGANSGGTSGSAARCSSWRTRRVGPTSR